ncbi:DUF2569 domain-containing protein [Paenibacillus puldeungensis]|uniref:DUF2569 domain-containing protein n=1 Tax=Paenibacillus puldeungensis TaxID=696536 RepID=A0ABW3S0U9_9BACL
METEVKKKNIDYRTLDVSGLGGWLILVQISLYASILSLIIQLFAYLSPDYISETWNVLTSEESMFYHPLWGPTLIFEVVCNSLLLLFSLYILIMLYRKKSALPRLMIVLLSVSLLAEIIDTLLLFQIPLAREAGSGTAAMRNLVKSLISCAIWIPYFLKSDRVKSTFIK